MDDDLDKDLLEAYRTSTPEVRRKIRAKARKMGVSKLQLVRLLVLKNVMADDKGGTQNNESI